MHIGNGRNSLKASSIPNYNRINEWPLQFLRTGSYGRSYGSLYGRITDGRWWSNAASSVANGHYLDSWADNVYAQNSTFRGLGFALRCGGAGGGIFGIISKGAIK